MWSRFYYASKYWAGIFWAGLAGSSPVIPDIKGRARGADRAANRLTTQDHSRVAVRAADFSLDSRAISGDASAGSTSYADNSLGNAK